MKLLAGIRERSRHLKAETFALYLVLRDPRTPWYAKLFVSAIVAYAFSPIDLIPDVIPVLGYLDDLILLPLGVILARKLIPNPVLNDCRVQAQNMMSKGKPVSQAAGVVIVISWIVFVTLCLLWAYSTFFKK